MKESIKNGLSDEGILPGGLEIQKLIDGTWEEEYMSFGVEKHCAKTYHGLSLQEGDESYEQETL